MGGGILSGLVWGVVVSAVALAVVSLSTPLPERPDQPRPEITATAPAAPAPEPEAADPAPAVADTPPPTAPSVPMTDGVTPPQTATAPAPEAPTPGAGETAALAVPPAEQAPPPPRALPQVDPAPAMTVPDAPTNPAAPEASAGDAPAAPDLAPSPPDSIAAPPQSPAPAGVPAAPSPRFSATVDGSAGGTAPRRLVPPQSADTLTGVDTTDPAPAPVPPEPETDPAPPPAPAGAAPLPQVTAIAPALPGTPASSRLPQAGADAPAPDATADTPEAPAAAAPEVAGPPNALRDNAVAFDAPADFGLMAVVLIDDPDSALDPQILTGLSFPVSFAIDPLRPGAAARAAELRAAGHEVIILAGDAIPEGATPGDVEITLAAAQDTIPQAVAVMDTPASRIQADRPVLDAAVASLAGTGHGLLAFPRGLNAAEETARRSDLPAATFFRLLDDEDQRATVITRYLGRAAFAAGQEGAVVVAGRTRPDTVTALISWALGSRSEGVELAPVSAVLQRLSE